MQKIESRKRKNVVRCVLRDFPHGVFLPSTKGLVPFPNFRSA
jgi:hypothetical protein